MAKKLAVGDTEPLGKTDAETLWKLIVPQKGIVHVESKGCDYGIFECSGCKIQFLSRCYKTGCADARRDRCFHLSNCSPGRDLFQSWKQRAINKFSDPEPWNQGLRIVAALPNPKQRVSIIGCSQDEQLKIVNAVTKLFANCPEPIKTLKRFSQEPGVVAAADVLLNHLKRFESVSPKRFKVESRVVATKVVTAVEQPIQEASAAPASANRLTISKPNLDELARLLAED